MTKGTQLDKSLQQAIERIGGMILHMAELDEKALRASLRSLVEKNGQVAYSVILQDREIDEAEKEIDRLCLEFLVRQQPAAGNLRFVYAAIKINQELERIGDYAESIARQSLVLGSIDPAVSYDQIRRLAEIAIPMVRQSVKAFIEQDENLAWKNIEEEEKANEVRDAINAELYELHKKEQLPLEALTPLMTVARRFERTSDQCKNICEEVLYLCTGKYMKHLGTEVFRVLFVDDRNSCASQMAEGIGNALDQPHFVFSSAGMAPEPVDPRAVEFLAKRDVDISGHIAKSVDQIPNFEHYHVIIALSKNARKVFPQAPTKTVGIDWSLEDPSQKQGTEEEIEVVYEAAFNFLKTQINDLVNAMLGVPGNQRETTGSTK